MKFAGENGYDTIEAPEVSLVCDTPLVGEMFIADKRIFPISQRMLDQYAEDLLNGSGKDFVYEYHDRMVNSEGIDQLEYCVEKLRKSPVTRRAVVKTWQPKLDCFREDVPCLQLLHFTIRNGKLHMKVVFRSEDMHLGLGPNMYGLVRLQEAIAEAIIVPVGTYTHVAFCPHLYWWRDEDYLIHLV